MHGDSLALEQEFVVALRQRRAELRESMSALEQALAAPRNVGEERWWQRVNVALVELSADFREHIEITEGSDGLHGELLAAAPRLSNEVDRLSQEHVSISELVEDLVTRSGRPGVEEGVDAVRELGTQLLGRLVRHRQRGADLVFEAYEFDVGGET